MNPVQRSLFIKDAASRLGFSHCGISKAGFLEEEAPLLEKWLKKGSHGSMQYMERNFDKRLDPTVLVPGAKSVISLLLNYFPDPENRIDMSLPKISIYALGKDYHLVIKEKLAALHDAIVKEIGEVGGRAFVDSAPVMDKAWAKKSGLGWIGKNTNLINKDAGSFFFIAELILDLELQADAPVADHCGTCTACLDACPTGALVKPYEIDASRCISYLTIELKENIPPAFKNKMDDWIFGCDVCQDVCPWNRFSVPTKEESFKPMSGINELEAHDWLEMTEEVFTEKFGKSAISRTGLQGIKGNILFLQNPKPQTRNPKPET